MQTRTWSNGAYRFGFNGQEKDNEIAGEGNTNTATFWQYDSRLGRRWNIDPQRRIWEGSYSVLGNNPVLFIDPLGNVWGKGKEKAEAYKSSVENNKNSLEVSNKSLNKQLANTKRSGKKEKIQSQIDINTKNIEEYQRILTELDELANSAVVYNINDVSHKKVETESKGKKIISSEEGGTSIDKNTLEINCDVDFSLIEKGDYSRLGHELKHASQYENGKISYKSGGGFGILYDINDEVEAYQRGLFLADVGIGGDYRIQWLKTTRGDWNVNPQTVILQGSALYGHLSNISKNIHTPLKNFTDYKGEETYLQYQEYLHDKERNSPDLEIYHER